MSVEFDFVLDEAAGYVENVKSVQYRLMLQTFSFSTGSEFFKLLFKICL